MDEAERAIRARLEAGDHPTVEDVLDFMEARFQTVTVRVPVRAPWGIFGPDVVGEERAVEISIGDAGRDLRGWERLRAIVRDYRRRGAVFPPALTEAALYALVDKPKPSEGARPDSHRKTVIVETVEELKGILGTYAAAYEAVADRLEWADAESVRAPWRGARARRRLPRRSRPH